MNFEDDTQKVRRLLLDEALVKGIQQNEEQCKIWTTYKKGHQKVAETLQTFQKDLYVNCMVPIGKRALMKGKLIHTNEILACLGDGYFAKYSAAGAAALCERRIQTEEMLKNLNKERDLYETRMMMIENNLFEDYAGGEIVEHWNEDQITEWKKKHREREREYHQKLAKLRQEDRKKIETEDDLFNRLDQLEIEEELADELNRLGDKAYELFGAEELEEGQCYYESESSSNSEEEEKEDDSKEDNKQVPDSDIYQHKVETCKVKKLVSFAEPEDLSRKEKENLMKEKEKDFEEDILRIEFTHSKNKSVTKSNGDSIETPADIYRLLSKPKSILKRSANDLPPEQSAPPEYSTEDESEEDEDTVKPSAYETVVKDIKEKNMLEVTNEALEKMEKSTNTRPVSKFKRERQRRQ
ncbi:unconventional prefoldin RPB5 interactor-like protein isoform X2 [Bombus flavifrons]|uniref:unconventional prefoldin RPB5 interactor-like protein isoform X2 n=1 Tax=Bombus flavifrons TaxID=103934 RepID=UPI0037039A45